MRRRNKKIEPTVPLENALILNFIRICDAEGVKSDIALKELEARMDALNELKFCQVN